MTKRGTFRITSIKSWRSVPLRDSWARMEKKLAQEKGQAAS
jgi:hypothetical protein